MSTPVRNALLRGRNRPRSTGAGSPTLFRGDGYEFVELRQYVAGDDPRRIDWAATARVVLEDVALTLAAIVDDSPSMQVGRTRSLLTSAREALEHWYDAALADDRCARVTSSGLVAPLGLRGRRSALVALHGGQQPTTGVTQALHVAFAALPRGSALLVASDFFDLAPEHETFIRELSARFDCTALVARDPWYDELPLGGFVRVADAESGVSRTLFIGRRERIRYRNAVQARETALLGRLQRAGWRAHPLTEAGGEAALLGAFGIR